LFEKETWESEHQCHQQFHLTFQNGTNKCWWLFMKKKNKWPPELGFWPLMTCISKNQDFIQTMNMKLKVNLFSSMEQFSLSLNSIACHLFFFFINSHQHLFVPFWNVKWNCWWHWCSDSQVYFSNKTVFIWEKLSNHNDIM
jgi:hypothetical protein